MRAVVLDDAGQPALTDVPEPDGEGTLVAVRACGLCGSDVEKIGRAPAGTVLGHEVAAELPDGRRVALVHHLPCGECERCRSGHESTCDEFRRATIEPGGFAERARARAWIEIPSPVDDAVATFAEPLACVLRAVERIPGGEILVIGGGFIGRLFAQVLGARGDAVHVHDADPARSDGDPPGAVDAAVLCAPGGADEAAAAVRPGGTVLVFADAGPIGLDRVYRAELTVLGSRSGTPRHLLAAVNMLPHLAEVPTLVLPLERFEEGLAAYRARETMKVVFTP